jgi:hypothetical protein
MRRVRANIAAEKRNITCSGVCVYSLRYAVYNAHASCCHLWPVLLDSISPHYIINDTIFEKIVFANWPKKMANLFFDFISCSLFLYIFTYVYFEE